MPKRSVDNILDILNSNIKFDFYIKTNKKFVKISNELKIEDLKEMFLNKIKVFLEETEAQFYDPINGNSNGVEIEGIGNIEFDIVKILKESVGQTYEASIFKAASDFKWLALKIESEDNIFLNSIFLIYKQRSIKKI